MGLDVSLQRCDRGLRDAKLLKEAYGQAVDKKLSAEKLAQLRGDLGVDEDGDVSMERVKLDSTLHPDHMFKIGYLRSSYNDGGINNVLRALGLPDLYSVFDVNTDRYTYHISVDWPAALERAKALLDQLRAKAASPEGQLKASWHSPTLLGDVAASISESDALKVVRDELERHAKDEAMWKNFSGSQGQFWLGDPLPVVALVRSGPRYGFEGPGFWLVFRPPEGWLDWYIKAVEVTVEMCQWVIDHPLEGQGEWVLGWSA